jgi:hypothetical protein
VTLISQRAALVDKDLLTQCQNLLLLRLAAAIDRRAITDWVASNSAQIDVKRSLAEFSELPNGVGYLWAPNWLTSGGSSYSKVHIGRRKTLHPLGILMDPKPMLPIRDVEPEMI